MPTQHKLITEADLHENKGVSTAAISTVATSNGAGATVWQKIGNTNLTGITVAGTSGQRLAADGVGGFKFESGDHGDIYFVNTATPYVLAATTTFAKAAPTTTPSAHPSNFTESTNGRLTYTGPDTEHFTIDAILSIDQASGAARDVSIAAAVNGTVIALTEQIISTTSGSKTSIATHFTTQLTTNDYVEVFIKISTAGNVNVYCYALSAELI